MIPKPALFLGGFILLAQSGMDELLKNRDATHLGIVVNVVGLGFIAYSQWKSTNEKVLRAELAEEKARCSRIEARLDEAEKELADMGTRFRALKEENRKLMDENIKSLSEIHHMNHIFLVSREWLAVSPSPKAVE